MGIVAIVDYGLCNLDSVRRAVQECGGSPVVTSRPRDVLAASRVILPGVGAFPEAMANLHRHDLVDALQRRVIEDGVPFLGICLGMQLMATRSLEVTPTAGLGWMEAEVHQLEASDDSRVPHVGWDEVHAQRSSPLFHDVPAASDFYFVHSYVVSPRDPSDVLAITPHGRHAFAAAVERNNLSGVQFHPEKSQRVGFILLRNFLRNGDHG